MTAAHQFPTPTVSFDLTTSAASTNGSQSQCLLSTPRLELISSSRQRASGLLASACPREVDHAPAPDYGSHSDGPARANFVSPRAPGRLKSSWTGSVGPVLRVTR